MRETDIVNFVENLNWRDVDARIAAGAAAILPIGAGAKQHGFHLPMNTDRVQAETLAARIADQIDALIWPTVTYGYYPAFIEYAGSCSLSADTFERAVEEIAKSLLDYGCKAIFVLDTGISTRDVVVRALSRVASRKTLHIKIHQGPRYRLTAQQIVQQHHGSHADEIETSLMLAVASNLVDMTRAQASYAITRDIPGPLTFRDPSSPNFSPSGSIGDPTLATYDKGKALLDAITDDIVAEAKEFLAISARGAVGSGQAS